MNDFGLYIVLTDPVAGYERCCEAAVRAGVGMVQLRMKERDYSRDEVVAMAKALKRITMGTDTNLIIDDDPSVAAEAGADGVHVGQTDMKVAEVRRLYPNLRLVGLSTHNLDQAKAAIPQQPDYIGVGPVYATPTKKIPDPTLGTETAGRMIAMVPFPAVAIGGINFETLPAVLAAGAKNFAIVRAVCGSSDPYAAIVRLKEIAARG